MKVFCRHCKRLNDKCITGIRVQPHNFGQRTYSTKGCSRTEIEWVETELGVHFRPVKNINNDCFYYEPKWYMKLRFWESYSKYEKGDNA